MGQTHTRLNNAEFLKPTNERHQGPGLSSRAHWLSPRGKVDRYDVSDMPFVEFKSLHRSVTTPRRPGHLPFETDSRVGKDRFARSSLDPI